jgi:peptidoglycan/LPS O-acetylase OafA/YrhL
LPWAPTWPILAGMQRGIEGAPPIRSLDGIRAIAIAGVVLLHTVPVVGGGYIGVEVFFVLSGFLITTLLVREVDSTGSVQRGAFFARRALRLLPGLLVLLALSAVFVWLTGSNNGGLPLEQAMPAVLFYGGNWVEAMGLGLGYLSHTWSLAIEVQFYVVWPLLIVALARRVDAVRLLVIATVALVALRAGLTPLAPSAGNLAVWTTSKLDCLLIGAMLALVLARYPLRVARTVAAPWIGFVAGFAVIGVGVWLSVVASPERWSNYGLTTVVGVATAIVIAHVLVHPTGALAAGLGKRPLAGIGRVSYGIYLYHWPIVAWVGLQAWSTTTRLVVEFALIAFAVTVSWLVIEKPASRLKRHLVRAPVDVPDVGSTPLAREPIPAS